eukprot:TRINITY_DN16568_c0_g1_i1.p1 TRINITY_DN16568_c0_g1~~TRINITY_DN16568_c0_g1_i1.p1  ORF type:complete len:168 (+),score=28.94 TRINITY_DN16568_c0_g1_i1:73-576(+)
MSDAALDSAPSVLPQPGAPAAASVVAPDSLREERAQSCPPSPSSASMPRLPQVPRIVGLGSQFGAVRLTSALQSPSARRLAAHQQRRLAAGGEGSEESCYASNFDRVHFTPAVMSPSAVRHSASKLRSRSMCTSEFNQVTSPASAWRIPLRLLALKRLRSPAVGALG